MEKDQKLNHFAKGVLHLRKRHVYDFEQLDLKKEVSTALQRFNLQTNQ